MFAEIAAFLSFLGDMFFAAGVLAGLMGLAHLFESISDKVR